MVVGIFRPDAPADHAAALDAFAQGLAVHGVEHFVAGMNYKPCDVAVVFGTGKWRVPQSWPRSMVICEQQARGLPYILLEKGFVRRDEYFHAGWNGLNGRADFRNRECPGDRWHKLNVHLADWRERGEHVLICGQVPHDSTVQHTHHVEWCRRMVKAVKVATDRPVVFRGHPKANIDYGVLCPTSHTDIERDLRHCHAAITFNSNAAVDAAIAGVPVFAFDHGSMAWDVAGHCLKHIEKPKRPDRTQWAYDLAYAQWTLEEMTSGETWSHLTR